MRIYLKKKKKKEKSTFIKAATNVLAMTDIKQIMHGGDIFLS